MKIAILEVCAKGPSNYHKKLFDNKENIDFYYVTFKEKNNNKNCLKFCPNTHWAETRNILYKLVPKEYDYYFFIDEDIVLESNTNNEPIAQILIELEKYYPAVLVPHYFHPNKLEFNFPKNKDICSRLFSNNCVKIIHHSVLDWFFPYVVSFGGGFSSCHFFNFLEIPFKDYILTTKKIISKNTCSSGHASTKDNSHKKNVQKIWEWIKPSFKKKSDKQKKNPIEMKKYYQKNFTNFINIKKNQKNINFMELVKLNEFFDLNHVFFKNKK